MHIYTWLHVYMYAYIHIYIYMYIYIHSCYIYAICMHMHTCMRVCFRVFLCTQTFFSIKELSKYKQPVQFYRIKFDSIPCLFAPLYTDCVILNIYLIVCVFTYIYMS